VPGITAASGCASYAGIPLTHRDYAQTVMFITAHCKNSEDTMNWASIAKHQQTVAVYMGLMRNEVLSQKLIEYGRLPTTPVAIIENGTYDHKIRTPAMIVIGEVVSLANKLSWFAQGEFIQYESLVRAESLAA